MKNPFMAIALKQAQQASSLDEVPVGACLVEGASGRIIAQTGNRMRHLKDPTAHAEMLALKEGFAALKTSRLPQCDLYITLEPCAMCAAAISLARIRRLYYGAADLKAGAIAHNGRFFASPACFHAPQVYEGIGESEAQAILREFFADLRKKQS